jgi:peroxiredoxin
MIAKKGFKCSTPAIALGLLLAALVAAAEVKPPALGDAMPDFTLQDQKGREHRLASYAGRVVVFDFCSITCPFSRGVDPDFGSLAAEYQKKGVVFLSVESNKDNPPENIKKYAAENRLEFPILKDAGNAYADAVGAARTPEIYVFDANGKLVYHGAFDDRKTPATKGKTNYVKNALDDLLAGRPVRNAEIPAWGCAVNRVK